MMFIEHSACFILYVPSHQLAYSIPVVPLLSTSLSL